MAGAVGSATVVDGWDERCLPAVGLPPHAAVANRRRAAAQVTTRRRDGQGGQGEYTVVRAYSEILMAGALQRCRSSVAADPSGRDPPIDVVDPVPVSR